MFLGCLFIELIMISENLLTKTINITDPDLKYYYSARDGTEKEIPNSINYIYFKDVKEGKYCIFGNDYQEYYISGGDDGSRLGGGYRFHKTDSHFISRLIRGRSITDISSADKKYQDSCGNPINIRCYIDVNLICKINNEYKEIYIQELKYNEKPNLIYKLCFVSDLKPNSKYIISNFTKSEYNSGGVIISEGVKYYVSKKVLNILETYFECKNDNIYCKYNNKKEIAKLTLITEDEIITDNDIKILHQSLRLEIGNKKFTFYINNFNLINYKKEGKYCFLFIHIYNSSLYNYLIYGYEFKEDKYYYLKLEERVILKNINQKISKNLKKKENQDLYTCLLSNNEKCGMLVSIDEDKNVTHKLVKLNVKYFDSILDISLLKPVSKWYKKPCNIDNINKFDDIIEGF